MKLTKTTLILIYTFILGSTSIAFASSYSDNNKIVIENIDFALTIGTNAQAISLIHKSSSQECLSMASDKPIFSITQYRPYDNELQLAYPAKSKTFGANSVCLSGDDLIIHFELINVIATVELKITDQYIGFSLKKIDYEIPQFGDLRKTRIDEFTILQLPIRKRKNFGEWLNVTWDNGVAINLLATDPYAKIDAENQKGYHLFNASAVADVKTFGVGAALIVTQKDKLLDNIAQLEEDFDLPRGVKSRRSKEYKYSYYEAKKVSPQNIDRHIEMAKRGGFRAMELYYDDFAIMGHFSWLPVFPDGLADLKAITKKIKDAGLIPGFHIHYNKANKIDPYVSPNPDHRLNLTHYFTLAGPLEKESTTITVEENPRRCTMEEQRRILKIGNELIEYENYTTTFPYQFEGCKRAALGSTPSGYESGFKFGLLDVDTWPRFVRFNQNTSIQQEVAEKVGELYKEAGFEFVYFDGAEDVHPPYWFNTSIAQLKVYNCLDPKPLFSEGAVKSHFSWHILTRGNAFDVFAPEFVKESTRKHPAAEAEFISNDFTSINFGWMDYREPSEKTIGMQPDMYEYVCSRAAAWDCPSSLDGWLDRFEKHPRTNDNLEMIRRWEEVRINNILTPEQKKSLQNLDQEHTLFINERGEFELYPYSQITEVAGGNKTIRAFIFERLGKTLVIYWHTSNKANIELNINPKEIRLFKKIGDNIPVKKAGKKTILSVDDRKYLETKLPKEEVMSIFKNATLIKSK